MEADAGYRGTVYFVGQSGTLLRGMAQNKKSIKKWKKFIKRNEKKTGFLRNEVLL